EQQKGKAARNCCVETARLCALYNRGTHCAEEVPTMIEAADEAEMLPQAAAGDETALSQLFTRYRKRLKQMVRLRLNRRLQGRIDDSDILQEAYLEAAKRLREYLAEKPLPFFLWLRRLTGEKLIDAHRRHLGAKMRDAGQEVSLH